MSDQQTVSEDITPKIMPRTHEVKRRGARRIASMLVPGDTFMRILLDGRKGFLHFVGGLPADVQLIGVHTEWELCPPTLSLLLESSEFAEVPNGEYPPRLNLKYYVADFREELRSLFDQLGWEMQ